MNIAEALKQLRETPSVSVPLAGFVLGNMTPNAAYEAAKRGNLGVPTFKVGKRIRVASVHILERLAIASDFGPPVQSALAAAPEPAALTVNELCALPTGSLTLDQLLILAAAGGTRPAKAQAT